MIRTVLVLVAFFVCFSAQAKWKPQYADASPEVQKWFSQQHNSAGQWCCDKSDGHRFDGTYWFNPDGSVTVEESGKQYKIEAFKVLSNHNPTGQAVWWFVDAEGGRQTYCFSPGSLT